MSCDSEIKTIGVLTSGGDAPGMNAAIRAVVRSAFEQGKQVIGIHRGFSGLLDCEYEEMNRKRVTDIISRGGTILYTARSKRFMREDGPELAAKICRNLELDALVIIGGDGSFRGGRELTKQGINVIGIPGTIDLDIGCTEYTIGFDTAVNTAMQAIDKIRDTSTSHERVSIIEVMGRKSGFLALRCGLANGAEDILIPEKYQGDEHVIFEHILKNRAKGKKHHIIINAEGIGDSINMAKRIEEATCIETRATILGYMQRGGSPTCRDRVTASVMGAHAVKLICEGIQNRIIAYSKGECVDYDLEEALEMKKSIDEFEFSIAKMFGK